jgi:hypothetical protein
MMPDVWTPTPELEAMAAAVSRGTADDHVIADFEAMLRDEHVCQWYCEFCLLDAELRFLAAADKAAAVAANRIERLPKPPVLGFLGEASPMTLGYFISGWPMAYCVAMIVLGLGLSIGSLVHVSPPTQIARQFTCLPSPFGRGVEGEGSGDKRASVVGRISGMVDCVWDESGQQSAISGQQSNLPSPARGRGAGGEGGLHLHYPLATSHSVALGDRFALRSGLLEITYDTGARVILQGPVTYKVDSAAGGYLSVGKLTARLEGEQGTSVPYSPSERKTSVTYSLRNTTSAPRQQGTDVPRSPPLSTLHSPLFTITTPTAVVTDLGTEFGVEVNKSGETSAHVFRGLVEVQWAERNGKPSQTVRLKANEAIQLSPDKRGKSVAVHRIAADSNAFVRVEPGKSVAAAQLMPTSFVRWQSYLKTVRNDPAMVVCYDFQRQAATPKILHADPTGAPSELDGHIEGAVWTNGRMSGKNALRFDGEQTRVKVSLSRKLTQLTLAAWLTIEVIDDRELGCCVLAADWRDEVLDKAAWQIYRQGQLHFGTPVFDTETPDVLPWSQWGRSRWRHIAVTVDPSHRRLSHYVDGKQVYTCQSPEDFTATFGSASIGNWFSNHGAFERGFRGRIDDLMIFSRELADREIAEMYEAGKR